MHRLPLSLSLLFTLAAVLGGCAGVDISDTLERQQPRVSFSGSRLTHLDFERADIAFAIEVDNPNPVALQLAGLDYSLQLAGENFLSGRQEKTLQLAAAGRSHVELPLSIAFADLFNTAAGLKGKDSLPYTLTTGLSIEVPLLGRLRYPVTTKGVLPVPKLPTLSLKNLSVDALSFNSATLLLTLELDNPNSFDLALQHLNYAFAVNGKRWASGKLQQPGALKPKQKSTITLPISLNFLELGNGLYSLLQSGNKLNYEFRGTLDATSSHQLIGKLAMPFDNSGQIKLGR